jgi:DNA-binding CsgD family transcriptional regulator
MIDHLSRIADHLSTASTFDDAIEGIAMFACLSGSSSRFYLAKIEKDLQIAPLADIGFDAGFTAHRAYGEMVAAQLMIGHPSHHSLVFIEHDREYRRGFKTNYGVADGSNWKCTILMAISPRHIASLTLHTMASDNVNDVNYFNAIRSMLSLFMKSHKEQVVKSSDGKLAVTTESQERETNSTRLTERQEIILRMIELGDTNNTIAERMGYSESLIRQETIAIYRKLGISGRKDLDTGR